MAKTPFRTLSSQEYQLFMDEMLVLEEMAFDRGQWEIHEKILDLELRLESKNNAEYERWLAHRLETREAEPDRYARFERERLAKLGKASNVGDMPQAVSAPDSEEAAVPEDDPKPETIATPWGNLPADPRELERTISEASNRFKKKEEE